MSKCQLVLIMFAAPLAWMACRAPLIAAPFEPRFVAADAKWLVHVDLEAFRQGKIGQHIRQQWLSQSVVKRKIKKLIKETGFNPTEDLIGVTLYDTRFKKRSGVLIFHLNRYDSEALTAHLQQKPEYNRDEHGFHHWTEPRGANKSRPMVAALLDSNRIVVSHAIDQVKWARSVLAGQSASLAANSPLAQETSPGTVLMARGMEIDGDRSLFRSPALRSAQSLSVTVAETDARVRATAKLDMESSEAAAQVKALIDGFKALILLSHAEDDRLKTIIDRLSAASADQTVTVEWTLSSHDVLDVAKSIRKHRQKHDHRHRKRHKDRKHSDQERIEGDRDGDQAVDAPHRDDQDQQQEGDQVEDDEVEDDEDDEDEDDEEDKDDDDDHAESDAADTGTIESDNAADSL